MLNFDLGKVAQRETKIRRRAFTLPDGDATIVTPQDRLAKRNRTIAARYYYWTEIKRRRFDDVMKILSDYEFFVGERTIQNALVDRTNCYTRSWSNAQQYRSWQSSSPASSGTNQKTPFHKPPYTLSSHRLCAPAWS